MFIRNKAMFPHSTEMLQLHLPLHWIFNYTLWHNSNSKSGYVFRYKKRVYLGEEQNIFRLWTFVRNVSLMFLLLFKLGSVLYHIPSRFLGWLLGFVSCFIVKCSSLVSFQNNSRLCLLCPSICALSSIRVTFFSWFHPLVSLFSSLSASVSHFPAPSFHCAVCSPVYCFIKAFSCLSPDWICSPSLTAHLCT